MVSLIPIALHQLNRSIKIGLSVILITQVLSFSTAELRTIRELVVEADYLDKFVSQASSNKRAIVWEYGRSKDFSLLWGRVWAGGFYYPQMAKLFPQLYDLDNYIYVRDNWGNRIPTDSLCWEALFIQKASYPDLIKHFPSYQRIPVHEISETQMFYLDRPECSLKEKL